MSNESGGFHGSDSADVGSEGYFDQILAQEMESISAMLLIAGKHGLTTEVIMSYTALIRQGKSILDATGPAVCEWVK